MIRIDGQKPYGTEIIIEIIIATVCVNWCGRLSASFVHYHRSSLNYSLNFMSTNLCELQGSLPVLSAFQTLRSRYSHKNHALLMMGVGWGEL